VSDGSDDPTAGDGDGAGAGVFETAVRAGVCRIARPGTRWLSTGWDGGVSRGPAAYNVTVPEGWPETDLAAYVAARRADAGFGAEGPTLLTGVSQAHARRARLDGVEAVVTAGLSNPAALPVGPDATGADADADTADRLDRPTGRLSGSSRPGTVNVVVGTTRAVAAEAKAATLLAVADVPGTTTDAVVAGCDPDGRRARFSGSATVVGRAARACVRDALLASLDSRYPGDAPTVETAEYGVVTDVRAAVRRV
jgi:adenosylcobinamide hydrolase